MNAHDTIILPKISYCRVAWSFALTKTQRIKLKTQQNLVLKTALRTSSSTPKLANTILTKKNLPLDLYIQQACLYRASSTGPSLVYPPQTHLQTSQGNNKWITHTHIKISVQILLLKQCPNDINVVFNAPPRHGITTKVPAIKMQQQSK